MGRRSEGGRPPWPRGLERKRLPGAEGAPEDKNKNEEATVLSSRQEGRLCRIFFLFIFCEAGASIWYMLAGGQRLSVGERLRRRLQQDNSHTTQPCQ